MVLSTSLCALRRSLLIKILSRQTPSRADVASILDRAAPTLVEALDVESVLIYFVEGSQIAIKHICYSPSLWAGDERLEHHYRDRAAELRTVKLPRGRGLVGKVIETGEPIFTRNAEIHAPFTGALGPSANQEIHSTYTLPLQTTVPLGAIELNNKDLAAGTEGEFTLDEIAILAELGEYISVLLHRMLDPKYRPGPDECARYIARFTELPLVSGPGEIEIDPAVIQSVGGAVIRKEGVLPYKRLSASSVAVLMTNPLDYARREAFTRTTSLAIEEVKVVSESYFEALLKQYVQKLNGAPAVTTEDINICAAAEVICDAYSSPRSEERAAKDLAQDETSPIVQLTNRIIEDAYVSGASDIHIETTEGDLLVRYRVDGLCQDRLRLPKEAAASMVTRLKIMCNLDISESRLPQDGRIAFKKYSRKGIDIDLRVAVCPINHGEKVVLRILDKGKSALPLDALGFSEENLSRYRDCIRQPYGMILHCGPTGSGKSMTLYSALGEVNTRDVNIQTAEDPIEYTLPGLNQTQMNRQIGLTFARALRAYLRMDPDVILLGEIRDQETAQIAVEASLTGHLLVSTLHTNDAPSTVARLTEMGIEPFNISASLVCVCGQRLLRRVCKNCRVPYEPAGREEAILQKAIDWTGEIFRANPNGCPACGGTGYKGRVGIHELLVNSPELTEAINKGAETAELKRIAMSNGMKTLHQDGMLKVRLGVTTLQEALANVPQDMVATPHQAVAHFPNKVA